MKIKVFDNHPVEKNWVCIGLKIPLRIACLNRSYVFLYWNPVDKSWEVSAFGCWFNREDLTNVMNDMYSY